MSEIRRSKGPRFHCFLIYFFSLFFGVLLSWLLGFLMRDIGTVPPPPYAELEKRHVDQELLTAQGELQRQNQELERRIQGQQSRQVLLRDSTSSSQNTLNQLLELQKLSLQKGVALSGPEQQTLEESKTFFLSSQKKYQELNEEISGWQEEQRKLLDQIRTQEEALREQRQRANEAYQKVRFRHELKLAGLKMAVLLPLLGGLLWLYLKKRGGLYAPLIYAAGAALIWRIGWVLHDHFPAKYFKYILLLAVLAAVVRVLVYLVRAMAFPQREWVLKQHKEAYEKFLCPVCAFPIRRGPLRYAYWTAQSAKKLGATAAANAAAAVDEAYACPVCSSKLFEKCEACGQVRHALLPACDKCGAVKDVPY